MGIFQPGGAGTQIHVYDDNDATGGHAAGSPHTWAEINAAFPVDFAILQTAAGGTFSATHRQYLCVVDLMIGHPSIGNSNTTTLTDTTGADIFSPNGTAPAQSRLRFTTANGFGSQNFNIGTKIGSGNKVTGKQGGSIHTGTSQLVIRANANVYGTFFDCGGNLTFQTNSSVASEYAGCLFQLVGSTVLGTGGGTLKFYNCVLSSQSSISLCTASQVDDALNFIWGATSPLRFYSSAASSAKLSGLTLIGAPTQADMRFDTPSVGNNAFDVTWSDTPGVPRIFTSTFGSLDVLDDYRTYDTKVGNADGFPISGIPVFIETDVEGPVLSAATNADGNIVFTDNPTSIAQVIKVRRYQSPPSGTTATFQDRVFTVWVNSYKDEGVFPPNPNYETKQFKFEWPGRDRLGTGYQADGGSFLKTLDVIRLAPGIPRREWGYDECEVA